MISRHMEGCPYTIFRYRSDIRTSGKMFDNILIDVEEQKEKSEDEPEENPEDD